MQTKVQCYVSGNRRSAEKRVESMHRKQQQTPAHPVTFGTGRTETKKLIHSIETVSGTRIAQLVEICMEKQPSRAGGRS